MSQNSPPRSLYYNSNLNPRLSGHFSIFGWAFFVLNSLLGIARQWSREKFAIVLLKPRSRVRILIYRTWAICNNHETAEPIGKAGMLFFLTRLHTDCNSMHIQSIFFFSYLELVTSSCCWSNSLIEY